MTQLPFHLAPDLVDMGARLLMAVAAGSAGLYLSTVFVSLVPVLLAVVAGVGGMGMLAWQLLGN